MKFKLLVIFGFATLMMGSCTNEVSSNPPIPNAAVTSATEETTKTKSTGVGRFQAAEHPTTGNVSIVNENGKRFLVFDEGFKTDSGPDLFVILHRNSTVPVSGVKEKDYVQLARLQKINGTQRYAIPTNVELADFRSVAVWCKQFNATFGFAPLSN
jgi:Electron transfer DM13